MKMIRYLKQLDAARTLLWCYLIWYLVTAVQYFDPEPMIWFNALGIGLIVGFALKLGVSGMGQWTVAPWQTFRLFATPFCVSSFAMLTVNQGYYLIIPPDTTTLVVSLAGCAVFVLLATMLRVLTW